MIKQGDQKGFTLLYDAYADAIYGIILRIVKNKTEADEILQSVFLKVWNNIQNFDHNKSTIYTWMAAIAKNGSMDVLRSKAFKNSMKNTSFALSDYGLQASSKIKSIDIEKLTKNLDEKYRFLIDKVYLEGYTQQEIADEFDMPIGTIKTRLREAVSKLRDELKNEKHLLYILSIL